MTVKVLLSYNKVSLMYVMVSLTTVKVFMLYDNPLKRGDVRALSPGEALLRQHKTMLAGDRGIPSGKAASFLQASLTFVSRSLSIEPFAAALQGIYYTLLPRTVIEMR
jgi:hypothetical protein